MANNANIDILIGANADQLLAVTDIVSKRLTDLKNKLSQLPQGSKDFIKIQREFNKINKEFEKGIINAQKFASAQQKISRTTPALAPLADGAKQARTAVTSLALVAQDLPFGFIGIQNNLPSVIQGFGNLKTTLGGTTPALKSLLSQLKGPAGLFLAFSAVTSAITFAVQKYGSLGEAYNALIASGKVLTKEQKEIASKVAEESTNVITLFGLYSNLEGEREKQIQIIKKLSDISPEYFGNLDAEKTKIDQLKTSIDKYIDSFIGKIFVETQQKKITELLTKYAEKITKVIDNEIALDKQRKKSLNDFVKQQEIIAKTQRVGLDIPIDIRPTNIKKTTQEVIKDLKSELVGQIENVFGETDIFKNFINISEIFGPAKKEGVDDFAEKSADSFYKYNRELLGPIEGYLRFIKGETTLQVLSIKKLIAERKKLNKETIKTGVGELIPTEITAPTAAIDPETVSEIERLAKLRIEGIQIQKDLENTYRLFNEVLFSPLNDLFNNFFDTGKFAFQEFGNAVLGTIKQLVSKIIATGIIALLASILFPGGGIAIKATAGGAGGAGSFGKNFLALLGFGGGNIAAPSFAGVGGGQLGFGGSVSLTLRGSDLVGAINRTNTTISRVG
jgi:hypothetical protein